MAFGCLGLIQEHYLEGRWGGETRGGGYYLRQKTVGIAMECTLLCIYWNAHYCVFNGMHIIVYLMECTLLCI